MLDPNVTEHPCIPMAPAILAGPLELQRQEAYERFTGLKVGSRVRFGRVEGCVCLECIEPRHLAPFKTGGRGQVKLSPREKADVLRRFNPNKEGCTALDLAVEYNCSPAGIYKIVRKARDEIEDYEPERKDALSPAQQATLAIEYDNRERETSAPALAKKYEVSVSTVWRILRKYRVGKIKGETVEERRIRIYVACDKAKISV